MRIVSGIVLGLILFVAYFCGGYVARRVAPSDGAKQGIAVVAVGHPHRHRLGGPGGGGWVLGHV